MVEDDADDALLISEMIRESWPHAVIDHKTTARDALAGVKTPCDVFLFVITSYSIHYTKLYDGGGACSGCGLFWAAAGAPRWPCH